MSLASSILHRQHGRHPCKQAAITPAHQKYNEVAYSCSSISSRTRGAHLVRFPRSKSQHSEIAGSARRLRSATSTILQHERKCIYIATSDLPIFKIPFVGQTKVQLRIPNVGISLLFEEKRFSSCNRFHRIQRSDVLAIGGDRWVKRNHGIGTVSEGKGPRASSGFAKGMTR
jgi:hypothetical protein